MDIVARCKSLFFRPSRPDNEVMWLRSWLEAIRDHEPQEIVKDAYAYDRMVATYREAAQNALTGVGK